MNFSKINELKPYDLNCNIFDVYSYDGLSMQELLCQFFTKINECIKTSNETIDLAEWLVNEGLKQETALKLTQWLNDGTLENLINETLFENLNNKIDDVNNEIDDVNNKIDNVSSQLEHITTTSYNLGLLGFKFDGSDESEKFQSLMPTSHTERVVITIPHNKELKIKNIYFTGYVHIMGNHSKIVNDNPNDFVFISNEDTNVSVLFVDNLQLKDIGLLHNQMIGNISGTRRCYIKNVWANSSNQRGTFFKGRSVDFCSFENVFTYDYHTNFDIQSSFSNNPPDRMNTQIKLKNIGCGRSYYALITSGVDKLSIDGFDIGVCQTPIIINAYTKRVNIVNFHCEYHGSYQLINEYDGYGIFFTNRNLISEFSIKNSSILLPGANAKGGVYTRGIANYNQIENSNFYFENFFVEKYDNPQDYKALDLNGHYKWIGKFDYTGDDVILGGKGSSNTVLKGLIQDYNYDASRNILPIETIKSTDDINNTVTNVTFTDENSYTLIRNNNSSRTDLFINFTGEIGWYTLIFNGDLMDNSNLVVIGQTNSPYKTFFSSSANYGKETTSRAYFYVSEKSSCRIVFQIQPGKTIKIGDIGLYKGFKSEF